MREERANLENSISDRMIFVHSMFIACTCMVYGIINIAAKSVVPGIMIIGAGALGKPEVARAADCPTCG